MRMGIRLGRLAMRGPARVTDADATRERFSRSFASRFFSLPSARTRVISPPSSTATPAES